MPPIFVSRCSCFESCGFSGSGGGNHDEDWHFEIRVQILLAEHVTDVAEYLDVVAAYRFGPPAVEIRVRQVTWTRRQESSGCKENGS